MKKSQVVEYRNHKIIQAILNREERIKSLISVYKLKFLDDRGIEVKNLSRDRKPVKEGKIQNDGDFKKRATIYPIINFRSDKNSNNKNDNFTYQPIEVKIKNDLNSKGSKVTILQTMSKELKEKPATEVSLKNLKSIGNRRLTSVDEIVLKKNNITKEKSKLVMKNIKIVDYSGSPARNQTIHYSGVLSNAKPDDYLTKYNSLERIYDPYINIEEKVLGKNIFNKEAKFMVNYKLKISLL
jgi:hypothetical protein